MKPRTKRSASLVAGLAVSALLITGCGASSSDKPNNPSTPKEGTALNANLTTGLVNVADGGTPVKGGTLTLADYAEPTSEDPSKTYANGSVGGNELASIYDTLVQYDFEKSSWQPQLAESIEQTDDTTWTLKLKKGTKFSDGTDLTADTVKASIDRYIASYGFNFGVWMAGVKEIKVVDPLTVQFTTNFKWGTFPGMLAQGPGMIVAPAAYKDPNKFTPIGAGPFTFVSHKTGESFEVKANPNYINGAPNLDGIKWTWPGADAAKLESLKNGDIDGGFIRDAAVVADALEAKESGMLFVTGAGATLNINQREGHPGANPNVRKAINLAMNPITYYDRIKNKDAVPNKELTPKGSPWYTEVEVATPDLAEAKKAVDAAKAEGFDGKITYSHLGDPVSTTAAKTIKAMLDAAGFEVTLDPSADVTEQTTKVYVKHTYDLAMGAISIGQEDPYTGLAGPLQSTSSSNAYGLKSKDFDAALMELAKASGPEDGKASLAKIEELWQQEVPAVNLADGNLMHAFSDKVHGYSPSTQMLVLFDQAWIAK